MNNSKYKETYECIMKLYNEGKINFNESIDKVINEINEKPKMKIRKKKNERNKR